MLCHLAQAWRRAVRIYTCTIPLLNTCSNVGSASAGQSVMIPFSA
jgi:hypothetical protein